MNQQNDKWRGLVPRHFAFHLSIGLSLAPSLTGEAMDWRSPSHPAFGHLLPGREKELKGLLTLERVGP